MLKMFQALKSQMPGEDIYSTAPFRFFGLDE